MSRFQYTNRNLELLEPYEWKRSRTVLRGESDSNVADLPDTPKDFIQRNGRGARKHNWVAKQFCNNLVDTFIYAVKQTLDVYKFNLQATKHNFISQIKSQNIGVRTIDEGGMDEHTGMNYNEYIAILSGDTSLLEKAKLEKKLLQLKMEETSFHNRSRDKDIHVDSLKDKIGKNESILSRLEGDMSKFDAIPRDADGKIVFKINIKQPDINHQDGVITLSPNSNSITYTDNKEAGVALNSLVETENRDNINTQKIGDFYGFPISIKAESFFHMGQEMYENRFYIEGDNILYKHNNGILPRTPELAGDYAIKSLEKIENLIEKHQQKDQNYKEELAGLLAITGTTFPKTEELIKTQNELRDVINKIESNISKGNNVGPDVKELQI